MILVLQILSTVSLALLVVAFVLLAQQKKRLAKSENDVDALKKLFEGVSRAQTLLQNDIHELRTGTLGVGTKVKQLVEELQQTRAKQVEMENTDPGSRHYAQAAKLVEQGYSIEDLMEECDLPRAEAELLFNLHKR